MILAEMSSDAVINCSFDLGSREMDQNYDWINDARQQFSDTDIMNANIFLKRASVNEQENVRESITVDYETLNEKQKIVFKRVESHHSDILAGNQVEPLRIIIMGTAGTGKTYLINAIRNRLREMTGAESESPVFVLAPTGVAAFNINRRTIHSTLSIPIVVNKNLDMNGERLRQLQNRLQSVKYVMIDEKSMVDR